MARQSLRGSNCWRVDVERGTGRGVPRARIGTRSYMRSVVTIVTAYLVSYQRGTIPRLGGG